MNLRYSMSGLRTTAAGAFKPRIPIFCFIAAAIITPFALLTLGGNQSNNLPWYFWTALALLMLSVLSAAFFRFAHGPHPADLSISPDVKRKE